MFIAASVAFVFLIGGAWWLFRLSVTNDDASSTDEAASAAPTRKLSDSLFGTWKLVEKRGGPPTISDEIKGTLVLEEGGAGILTIYGELFPMTFTVDDPRHPAKIICRRADANEPLVLSIDSFAPPRLVLKQSYTRMTFSVLGGNPEKAELVETQVYEKQKDFALPRAPKAVAALRQLGAAVLLDDNGDVDFVDLYPIAAISDTKPPTSQITDDDLKHLSGLTALRNLRAPSCRITNAGLSHLTSLRALRMLKLHENAISDDGLRAIAPLINLRELLLHSTSISDAGLIHIQKLQRLRHLGLASTQITDRGLQAVSTLRDMEDLNLHNTQVTDQGLKYLGELTKLKKLYLSNTKVTDKGVKELQARIPLCEINH